MSGEFEHVKDAKSSWDAQTVDTATQEQTEEKQAVPTQEDGGELEEGDEEMEPEEDIEEEVI